MGTDIEMYHRAPLDQRMTYAQAIVSAGRLLPRGVDNPGAVLLMFEAADMLGLHPMAGLTGIHIIEGKPSISANLMAALVRKAGHQLRVWIEGEGDQMKAVATIVRQDDADFTFRAEFSHKDAQTAGLLGKDVWKKYERGMLKSRAISEVAREGANDALLGAVYTPEELGGEVDDQGELVSTTPSAAQMTNLSPQTTASSDISGADEELPEEERRALFERASKLNGNRAGLDAFYQEIKSKGLFGVLDPDGDGDELKLVDYVVQMGKAAKAAEEQAAASADPETGEIIDAEIVEDEGPAAVLDPQVDAESPAEPPAKAPAARRTRKPANATEEGTSQG